MRARVPAGTDHRTVPALSGVASRVRGPAALQDGHADGDLVTNHARFGVATHRPCVTCLFIYVVDPENTGG